MKELFSLQTRYDIIYDRMLRLDARVQNEEQEEFVFFPVRLPCR